MKILVPAAAFLLGGAAFVARSHAEPAHPISLTTKRAEAEPLKAPAPEATPHVEAASAPSTPRPASRKKETAPARPAVARALVDLLRNELALDEEQTLRTREVLEARALEIAAYQAEVLVRGWIRLDEFADRIGQIRWTSYQRIGALLSPERAAEFEARWLEIADKDFISIEAPDDRVVSLD